MLRICGDKRYPPFLFYDSKDKLQGFNVDLITALAKTLNIPTHFEPMRWSDALAAVENGSFDVLVGVATSSKRRETYDFTQEYLVVSHCIFVSASKAFNICKLEDLKGLKVAVQKTDVINSDTIKPNFGFDLFTSDFACILIDELEDAVSQLISGQVDAFIGNQLSGIYVARQMGKAAEVKIVGEPIYTKEYAFAVSRGRTDLIELLNKGLAALKLNGKYEQICAKWFGKVEVDKQVLENVGAAIIGLNKVGAITFLNSFAQQLIFSGESYVRKHYMETPLKNLLNPALLQETLTLGRTFFDKEFMYTSNGEEQILSYNICPLYQQNGEIIGAIITIRDVTEETKLKQSLTTKDKMESLGYLLANIAHEIRNPLAAIKTFIELLPEMYDDPAYRDEAAHCIPQEINRLDRLIKELLEYARPQKANRMPCHVRSMIDGVLKFFKYDQKFNRRAFNVDIDDALTVMADEHQLKQIFINLIMNAVEATAENGTLSITARAAKDQVIVSIQDNGCGIPGYNLDKIYEPFFTTKAKGTGLGLFIVYQLVRENGGNIEIKSIEHIGTQVLLSFPGGGRQ